MYRGVKPGRSYSKDHSKDYSSSSAFIHCVEHPSPYFEIVNKHYSLFNENEMFWVLNKLNQAK